MSLYDVWDHAISEVRITLLSCAAVESLSTVAPGLHRWFARKRAIFGSAALSSAVSQGVPCDHGVFRLDTLK
jgi:hypothetical protein